MRELYQAEWIDYENQLKDGNIIHDVRGMCGLFAMPKDMLVNCFNEESRDRYGDNLLVVKSISDCFYLNDKKEIIGDRYEVIDKIDFKCFEDVGRLIEYLQNIDAKVAKKIKEKSDDRIRSLEEEKTKLKDELIDLDGDFNRMKSRKWLWLIAGFILEIFLSLFIK